MAEEIKEGNCHFCGKTVSDDFYCYGCKKFVCTECDEMGIDLPFGPHSVEDHKRA